MKLFYLLLLSYSIGFGQIGINNTTPNSSAELDIVSTTKGLLIPRMTRAQRILVATPSESLLVYQTDVVGSDLAGFYFFQSSWKYLDFSSSSWSTNGNSNTNPLNNYIGTLDLQPFLFKTAAVEQMRVTTAGRFGIGATNPSAELDIRSGTANTLRIDDGFQAAGNLLTSTVDGTTIWSTPLSLGLVGWGITGNTGTKPPSNSLGTLDAADLSVRTGGIEAMVIQGTGGSGKVGNVRINDIVPTDSQLRVLSAEPNGQAIKGKNLYNTQGNISLGVLGETQCLGLGSYAVRGTCLSSLGTINTGNGGGIGVLGKYTSSGAAVFGRAYYVGSGAFINNTLFNFPVANYVDFLAGRDYGVYGLVDFASLSTPLISSGIAVYGKNTNTTIGSAYGMYCQGNMIVGTGRTSTNGSGVAILKAASVPTTKGNQLVYCKESPEMWFEDFGFAQLQNGSVHVALDAMFLETVFIDASHKMHVVLQEQAESKGLYCIVDADHKGFTVKEKKGGNANIPFSYSIMAKRRFYQDHRFGVDSLQPFEDNLTGAKPPVLLTTDPLVMKAGIEKGIVEKERLFREQKKEEQAEKTKEGSKTSN